MTMQQSTYRNISQVPHTLRTRTYVEKSTNNGEEL